MTLAEERKLRVLKLVSRGFIICIIAIGLIIAGGTIYWLLSHKGLQKRELPNAGQDDSSKAEDRQIFTGIGQMRVSTTDPQPGMVILFVSFVYYPSDKAFSEELVLRIGEFRNIITGYIGSFSISELQKQDEESIKGELLSRFNAILRLGKIETMFFTDFMIVGEIH